jgi:hypothetical protein
VANVLQVWEGNDGWSVLGLRYYVHQDFDIQPSIGGAFDFIVSARLLGAQIGSATVTPLQNGPVNLNVTGAGTIKGEVNDWQGYRADGTPAAWNAGSLATARFTLTLDIDVTAPLIGHIVVKGFHKPVTVLLHWDAATKKYVFAASQPG